MSDAGVEAVGEEGVVGVDVGDYGVDACGFIGEDARCCQDLGLGAGKGEEGA